MTSIFNQFAIYPGVLQISEIEQLSASCVFEELQGIIDISPSLWSYFQEFDFAC